MRPHAPTRARFRYGWLVFPLAIAAGIVVWHVASSLPAVSIPVCNEPTRDAGPLVPLVRLALILITVIAVVKLLVRSNR